uniref:Uncharacterized protein n=1 Tax=uncultured organism MedDCM-OCT-S08-C169 TaxID=743633 RepID=D6PJ55_9ZZZZ|nr:hypothetical protein [uncultured organism MedDCM-OCT-S08-C169]
MANEGAKMAMALVMETDPVRKLLEEGGLDPILYAHSQIDDPSDSVEARREETLTVCTSMEFRGLLEDAGVPDIEYQAACRTLEGVVLISEKILPLLRGRYPAYKAIRSSGWTGATHADTWAIAVKR